MVGWLIDWLIAGFLRREHRRAGEAGAAAGAEGAGGAGGGSRP